MPKDHRKKITKPCDSLDAFTVLRALRGTGAAVFADLGGGEHLLSSERGKWTDPQTQERIDKDR